MNDNVHSVAERRRLIDEGLALHDRLKADAGRLRNEAIDEFVFGTHALVRDAAQQATRAANRFAARLRQHAKQRAFEA